MSKDEFCLLTAVGEYYSLFIQGLPEQVFIMFPVAHIATGADGVAAAVVISHIALIMQIGKTFNVQFDAFFSLFGDRGGAGATRACIQPCLCQRYIPKSSRKPYTPGNHAGQYLQPFQQA